MTPNGDPPLSAADTHLEDIELGTGLTAPHAKAFDLRVPTQEIAVVR
jgi:hypothetical protein